MVTEARVPPTKYYLMAQYSDDLVILGVRGQNICLRRKASEVLADAKILAGLSTEDAAHIGVIEGMTLATANLPKLTKK